MKTTVVHTQPFPSRHFTRKVAGLFVVETGPRRHSDPSKLQTLSPRRHRLKPWKNASAPAGTVFKEAYQPSAIYPNDKGIPMSNSEP